MWRDSLHEHALGSPVASVSTCISCETMSCRLQGDLNECLCSRLELRCFLRDFPERRKSISSTRGKSSSSHVIFAVEGIAMGLGSEIAEEIKDREASQNLLQILISIGSSLFGCIQQIANFLRAAL